MSGQPRPKVQVLFLCTGNYYRSRVAEEVFNHLCRHAQLDASAFSRGLGGLWPNPRNVGPISSNAVDFLVSRGIGIRSRTRMPMPCTSRDIVRASRIIGLDDREHRGPFLSRFPSVHRPIEFWRIGDVGGMDVGEATAGIYDRVEALVTELARTIHEPSAAEANSTADSGPSPSGRPDVLLSTPPSTSAPRAPNLQHSSLPRDEEAE